MGELERRSRLHPQAVSNTLRSRARMRALGNPEPVGDMYLDDLGDTL